MNNCIKSDESPGAASGKKAKFEIILLSYTAGHTSFK